MARKTRQEFSDLSDDEFVREAAKGLEEALDNNYPIACKTIALLVIL